MATIFITEVLATPVVVQFDEKGFVKYDEDKKVLTLSKLETKQVTEDVDGFEFVTNQKFDKTYVMDLSGLDEANYLQALADIKAMLGDETIDRVIVAGELDSHTSTKLSMTVLSVALPEVVAP